MRLRMPRTRRILATRQQNREGRHIIFTSLILPVRNCCLQLLFGLRTLMRALRYGESQPGEERVPWRLRMLTPEIAINVIRRRGALPLRY
jgi:hypothetical protein